MAFHLHLREPERPPRPAPKRRAELVFFIVIAAASAALLLLVTGASLR